MKKIFALLAGQLSLAGALQAQANAAPSFADKLCGCFEVQFRYAETFSPDTGYHYRERDIIDGGIEWVVPLERSANRVVLQHLLVVADTVVVKHWREDWIYESPSLFIYQGNNTWTKKAVPPGGTSGQWTQTVWEVSDAPRYQGMGQWNEIGGRTIWENTADAPLPRREYTIRSDYDILRRNNRIILHQGGWTHEQDNQKIIRRQGAERLLVEEKGINDYKRTDTTRCSAAKAYWDKHQLFWSRVRQAWTRYLSSHERIELKDKVDGRPLYMYLQELSVNFDKGKLNTAQLDQQIANCLNRFVSDSQTVAQVP